MNSKTPNNVGNLSENFKVINIEKVKECKA